MGILEVCAGGLEDCLAAQQAGAQRIELNSALFLGGLTPTISVLQEARKCGVTLPIICMVRPRGAGFCYSDAEKQLMYREAEELLQHGAQGIAFGFLTETAEIDWEATHRMIQLCQKYKAESVFHRAFDCAKNPVENLEQLIKLGCTRVLTSGRAATVIEGLTDLAAWQKRFGKQIQLLCGCGVTVENIPTIIQQTGIHQVHGSFKKWGQDPTTDNGVVSYAYTAAGDFEQCDVNTIAAAVKQVKKQDGSQENE